MKELTIIGATGSLAVPTIKRLVENNVKVTAIVRNKEKAKQLLPESVKLLVADLTDVSSLKKALKGCEYLYINLSTMDGPGEKFYAEFDGIRNIVEAAKLNNVKQIIQISGLGALRPDFHSEGEMLFMNETRLKGHRLIKESEIPYTFLHCTWFLSSLNFFIDNNNILLLGEQPNSLYWTNTTDFADHLTKAIANPVSYNQDYAVQGKEVMTIREAVVEFNSLQTTAFNIVEVPIPEDGFIGAFMKFFENYKEDFIAEKTWKDLGKPSQTLKSFFSKA